MHSDIYIYIYIYIIVELHYDIYSRLHNFMPLLIRALVALAANVPAHLQILEERQQIHDNR